MDNKNRMTIELFLKSSTRGKLDYYSITVKRYGENNKTGFDF